MLFQNKIEQCIKEIKELEKSFCEAQDEEVLPLSFFSSSIDILIRLKTAVYEIEAAQLQTMQEHLNKRDDESWETILAANILADTISRKVNPDFGKLLSLNDRFMFQRDLFHNNVEEMNQAFDQLNALQSLNDALSFLDKTYTIDWDSDSGIALRDLLDKQFT